jgi:heme-degrading monooxygenase HmoA
VKGRVVFHLRLKPGSEGDFLQAYEAIRHEVAQGVPGHIVDQVCQSVADPLDWLITSEWESLDAFMEWERTQEHRDLVKPMRECWDEAKSYKFEIKVETGHEREAAAAGASTGDGGSNV